jgi:hypothetical protein
MEQGECTVFDGETGDGSNVSVLLRFNCERSYVWEQP